MEFSDFLCLALSLYKLKGPIRWPGNWNRKLVYCKHPEIGPNFNLGGPIVPEHKARWKWAGVEHPPVRPMRPIDSPSVQSHMICWLAKMIPKTKIKNHATIGKHDELMNWIQTGYGKPTKGHHNNINEMARRCNPLTIISKWPVEAQKIKSPITSRDFDLVGHCYLIQAELITIGSMNLFALYNDIWSSFFTTPNVPSSFRLSMHWLYHMSGVEFFLDHMQSKHQPIDPPRDDVSSATGWEVQTWDIYLAAFITFVMVILITIYWKHTEATVWQ